MHVGVGEGRKHGRICRYIRRAVGWAKAVRCGMMASESKLVEALGVSGLFLESKRQIVARSCPFSR